MKSLTNVTILIITLLSAPAIPQHAINYDILYNPGPPRDSFEEIEANLDSYFAVTRWEKIDSTAQENIAASVDSIINTIHPEYPRLKLKPKYAFTLLGIKNIIFFIIPNPQTYGFNLPYAYNCVLNKYYYLPKASMNEINELLSTEIIPCTTDSQILRYGQLTTILMNSTSKVYFIADINEVLLKAATNRTSYYSLDSLKQFENIRVKLPSISRTNAEIEITYFAIIHETIKKIILKMKNKIVFAYEENNIANIPHWHGFDPRYR